MKLAHGLTRRQFIALGASGASAMACGVIPGARAAEGTGGLQQIPLKIGIRAASMKMVGDIGVIRAASAIPGLMGIELQVTGGALSLRDPETVRRYKREADRWGMRVPSLSGIWDRGMQIGSPDAGKYIRQSIRAAEMLGSGVILVAFFKENAPDMGKEASFGPIIAMLQATARDAAEAGVILGLENSLSPADNKKLVDLVGHPAVQVYYDVHNMAYYGHGDQAIPGIRLLGRERICAVHVKNGDSLIEESGPIDWAEAFRAFGDIGYEGWFVYETSHQNIADCVEDTRRNNAFLHEHARMPRAS